MIEEALKTYPIKSMDLSSAETVVHADLTDEQLVASVLSGDETAFACIFERYKRLVAHLVSRFFRQREEIEDGAQQAFTKIYFSLKDFRGGHERSFSSWVSRVTVNTCYDELRKRARRSEDLFSSFDDEECSYLERLVSDSSTDAESSVTAADLAEKMLSHLDPKERLAFTLVHGEDISVSEVAKIVGWSESNVKTRLFRCRTKLRNIFNKILK